MYDEYARREQLPGRIRWFYDHMWSDIVSWNCAWLDTILAWAQYNVAQMTSGGNVVTQGDMDICITHFANIGLGDAGQQVVFCTL